MSIQKQKFGVLPNGQAVSRYLLQNKNGMSVAILDYAGAIQQLLVPDRRGHLVDVVCGFDSALDYYYGNGHQGSLIGRFGNRIKEGRFTLEGKEYRLATNNGSNHLHGGPLGFSHRMWEATPRDGDRPALSLFYHSPDGEEGYPGALDLTVTYTLTEDNALAIHYVAKTDKTTILNPTNHAYFNLSGFASGSVLDHLLWVDADTFLPTDAGMIPTGELRSVLGTPFDFTTEKPVGRDIFADDADLRRAGGYDHCFNFTGGEAEQPQCRATLYSEKTGIKMDMLTTLPSVQIYTANSMNNKSFPLKGGFAQTPRSAICLETQKMPDSINQKGFTDVTLKPGEVYDHTTIYAFSLRKQEQ